MVSQLAQPRYMSECEIRLAREWYWKGVAVEHIAERLGRHRSRVWDKIGAEEQDETRGVGRKASLSEADSYAICCDKRKASWERDGSV